jgi:hypothetical protein
MLLPRLGTWEGKVYAFKLFSQHRLSHGVNLKLKIKTRFNCRVVALRARTSVSFSTSTIPTPHAPFGSATGPKTGQNFVGGQIGAAVVQAARKAIPEIAGGQHRCEHVVNILNRSCGDDDWKSVLSPNLERHMLGCE